MPHLFYIRSLDKRSLVALLLYQSRSLSHCIYSFIGRHSLHLPLLHQITNSEEKKSETRNMRFTLTTLAFLAYTHCTIATTPAGTCEQQPGPNNIGLAIHAPPDHFTVPAGTPYTVSWTVRTPSPLSLSSSSKHTGCRTTPAPASPSCSTKAHRPTCCQLAV